MVNRKFITHNGQIISSNAGSIISTLSGLEVEDITRSNQKNGIIVSDNVEQGDLLFESGAIFEHEPFLRMAYGYGGEFFEKNGNLYAMLHDNNYLSYYLYEDGAWKNVGDGNHANALMDYRIPGTYHTPTNVVNGQRMMAAHNYSTSKGLQDTFIQIFDDNEQVRQFSPIAHLDISAWPTPNSILDGNGIETIRQPNGGSVFQDSSGVIHYCVTYTGADTNNEEDFASNWDGNGNFIAYTLDTSTYKATPVTYDTSTIWRAPYGADFLEVSGNVYMIHVHPETYFANWDYSSLPLSSTDDNYPPTGRMTQSIYKWNPSTRHWNWHQANLVTRDFATFYKVKGEQIDASTYVFQRGGSGGSRMFAPYRYESSSGYFKPWGTFDTSAQPLQAYGVGKVFTHNNSYYMFAGGGVEFRRSFESVATGEYLSISVNKDASGNPEKLDYSMLRLYKYNESTDVWDRLYPEELKFRSRRTSSGALASHRTYTRGIDAYTFNGETHFLATFTDYGPHAMKLFKFNPSDESVTDLTPSHYVQPFPMRHSYKPDFIEKDGTTYCVLSHGDYPYFTVMEYATSGDNANRWVGSEYIWDTNAVQSYSTSWFKTSAGELYFFRGRNNSQRIDLHLYDVSASQPKKIADTNVTASATVTLPQIPRTMETFSIANKDFLLTSYQDEPDLFEIIEDASGVPFLLDTSTTTFTRKRGTHRNENDSVIVYDNKMFYFRAAYASPYGDEIYSWDGSSASWTEVSSLSNRLEDPTVSGYDRHYYSNNGTRFARTRGPIFSFILNGDLYYMIAGSDATPNYRYFKYNDGTGIFEQVYSTAIGRGSTPNESPAPGIVWRNKHWSLLRFNHNNQAKGYVLSVFDGSGAEHYGITELCQKITDGSQTRPWFWIDPDDKLYCLWTDLDSAGQLRASEVREDMLQYQGKAWRKLDDITESFRWTESFGIAMESGNKNDTIKIRKISKI